VTANTRALLRVVAAMNVLKSFGLAFALSIANLAVCAYGIEALDRRQVGGFVIAYGLFPALFTGAMVGAIAHAHRSSSALWRRAWIAGPAVIVVALLGMSFGVVGYIAPCLVPTLTAALLLERWTRAPEPPRLPDAYVIA
jgi:uncharacterized membrane protein